MTRARSAWNILYSTGYYMEVFLQVKSSQVKSSQVLGWTHLGWTHRLEALVFQVKRRGGLS